MEIQWTELGEFVKSVGIPFATVLLVLGPIIYAVYKIITVQGPRIVEKHNEFLEKTTAASDRNADSIAMMAAASGASQANHEATHSAIKEIVRGARKAIDQVAPELAKTVTPHLDRAEQAIERADR
jgi:hypothetical protein